jgi:hypothetical protein
MKKHLLRLSTLWLLVVAAVAAHAQDVTATWDFTNATVVAEAVALNGSTTAGTIKAVEDNGILLTVEANGQTIRDNGNSIQTGNVVFKVPVQSKGDVVTVNGYSAPYFAYSIGGTDATEATTVYTAKASDVAQGYVEIVNKSQYLISISVTQKASTAVTLTWDYTENKIPTKGPDNGLYYEAYVNDAPSTNQGLNGVKLNSTGYAYFEKPAVAGKLTLSFGNRKTADAYVVNVYACTIADGVATKGSLIGEVAIDASPNTGSIDIPADVTGIFIERKTGAEGVLCKVVFKESVARSFVDFEITNEQMMKEGFDGSTLPAGVTFTGTHRGDNHGYGNVTIVVPVDGTVKFTIGGCRYANPATCMIKNAAGEVLAEPTLLTSTCYHEDQNAATYFYTGEPTTLTFSNIAYLPYFKAEATEVSEATITFRDQNNKELGTKTVFEGEPVGDIPYTEADLTIPDGQKFRGWVNANGVKVKATDFVSGNMTILASVTPIESVSVGSVQVYDLRKATFYPEDHETFSVTDGSYYNDHGFTFNAGGSFTVDVAGKAQIVLMLCQYGNGTTIKVTDANGNVIKDDMPAIAESDGGMTSVSYDGPATQLTFTFAAQTYLHMVTVYNVTEFLAKDETSGYYIVPAGDGAGLLMALNTASGEEGAKIFLPNGTYDLGTAAETSVSGKNISIIGESAEKTIITSSPKESGLGKGDLLVNSGSALYMQDITLKNNFAYSGNEGQAPSLHDMGTQTICKNVRLLSYQDTYYSHKVGGVYYWEDSEIHGTVDYLCGNGHVYYNKVKLVNEVRGSATVTANSELYVFNDCTIENNADTWNLGRAWSDNPTCIYLNTTLLDPTRLVATRWLLKGINCDYKIAGEYGTKDASGQNITPASNEVTFTKANTKMNTILSADQAATYTIDYVLGDWAATAQQQATQLDAPANAAYADGKVTWTPANNGATAYLIEKNGEFVGITEGTSFDVTADPANDALTIRAANSRGGFGPAAPVAGTVNSISSTKVAANDDAIYTLQGVRVKNATRGLYIKGGKTFIVK